MEISGPYILHTDWYISGEIQLTILYKPDIFAPTITVFSQFLPPGSLVSRPACGLSRLVTYAAPDTPDRL